MYQVQNNTYQVQNNMHQVHDNMYQVHNNTSYAFKNSNACNTTTTAVGHPSTKLLSTPDARICEMRTVKCWVT